MSRRGETGLMADLAALGISFESHEHVAVFTVAESRAIDRDIPGAHTKNLFLKDAAGDFWLVTVPAEARVDLKALPDAIGCKRVSFAKPEDMTRLLGIEPGSVTPLAMINAAPGSVGVALSDHHLHEPLEMLRRADMALFRAKAECSAPTLKLLPAELSPMPNFAR